jgi:hypothetical protein
MSGDGFPILKTCFLLLFFFFLHSVSLDSPGWPKTCDPPALASQVLGL